MFASVDPDSAAGRGVPTRTLSLVFMLLLGLAVALAVQVVGALLVLSLLITPAAAAPRVSASPLWVPVLSTTFAMTSAVGGILIALGARIPISPYVTTISFTIYVLCRIAGAIRGRRGWTKRRTDPLAVPAPPAAVLDQKKRKALCTTGLRVTRCWPGGGVFHVFDRPALRERPCPVGLPSPLNSGACCAPHLPLPSGSGRDRRARREETTVTGLAQRTRYLATATAMLVLAPPAAAAVAAPTTTTAARTEVHVLRASFASNIDGVGPFHGTIRVTGQDGQKPRAVIEVRFDAFPLGGTCADGVTPFTVDTTMRGAGPATLMVGERKATATGQIRYTQTIVIDNCTGADISDSIAPLLSPDAQPFTVALTGADDWGRGLRRGTGTMAGNDSLGDPFSQPLPARGVFGEM